MKISTILIVLIVLLVALAAVSLALKGRLTGSSDALRFKAKALLTPNELEFLDRLEVAVPELRFCPQVALGALLDPAVPRSDAKAYYRMRGMFSQKIVDFVAQQRSDGRVIALIELDDRTHNANRDARRDAMTQSAGYKVIRWNSKAKPDAATIQQQLRAPVSPVRADGNGKAPGSAPSTGTA